MRKRNMIAKSSVIGIVCSDIHLSHEAPVNRAEKGVLWYKAQAQYLYNLHIVKERYPLAPILIAGDIFDKWNAPAELINFALKELPDDIHAIPGQHDLPNHKEQLIHKSAYWTLVEAGKIENIPTGESYVFKDNKLEVVAFPWNHPLRNYDGDNPDKSYTKVALIHKYCYNESNKHNGVLNKKESSHHFIKELKGFDIAVVGDNHKHFSEIHDDFILWNCGSLMKRTIDQKHLHTKRPLSKDSDCIHPKIGIIIRKRKLSIGRVDVIGNEKWIEDVVEENSTETNEQIKEFVKDLFNKSEDKINFRANVLKMTQNENPEIREIISEILE